jgi:hypothetical protein
MAVYAWGLLALGSALNAHEPVLFPPLLGDLARLLTTWVLMCEVPWKEY